MFAQELCGTDMDDIPTPDHLFLNVNQNVTMDYFQNEDPVVIRVHFWDFANDNGDNIVPLTESQMLDVVAGLNQTYKVFNIFFKYTGVSIIESDEFNEYDFDVERAAFLNFLKTEEHYIPGVLNMYAPEVLQGVTGYRVADDTEVKFQGIVIQSDGYVPGFVVNHEVGHFCGLLHTFPEEECHLT